MKTRLWVLMVLAALAGTGFSAAQVRPGQKPAPRRAPYMDRVRTLEESQFVTKVVLKNGMTILVNEYRANPVVDVLAYVKAGYQDEPDETAGIARVLSRMMFKATPNREAGVIPKDLQSLGASLNTSVDYDSTIIDLVVNGASWKRALELQADGLLNPVFNPEELRKEKELALMETKAALSEPRAGLFSKLLEVGFTRNHFRIHSGCTPATLSAITPERLNEFYRAKYDPTRIIIVVAGDVVATDVLNEATRLYEPAKTAGLRPGGAGDKAKTGFQYAQMRGAIPYPVALFGFSAPSSTSEDFAAFEVLRFMLGDGASSVLKGRLVLLKQMALLAEAGYAAYADAGCLTIRLEMEPKDVDRCELAALTELELLKRNHPDDGDMRRAVSLVERAYWRTLQQIEGRARILARYDAQGSWKGMNGYLEKVRRVKPDDIVKVAARYLRLENCSLIEYLPAEAEARNLTAETALRTFRDLLAASADQEFAEREKVTVSALTFPEGSGEFKFSELRYPMQTASILRGPDLAIREDHTAPLIEMGFYYPGGKLFEHKSNSGITELLVRSMLQSSTKRSPWDMHRQLGVFGADVSPVIANDYFGFYVSVLSANIEPVLALLGEMVTTPKLDKDEINRQKQLQLADIRREKAWDPAYPRDLAERALYGDFPYGFPSRGSEASVSGLSDEAVRAWYSDQVRNRKPIVVIIGDTQGTSLASYFVSRFSGSRFQTIKLPELTPQPAEPKSGMEDSWDRSASVIALAFKSPPEGDEDSYGVTLLRTFLAWSANEQIRGKQGLAYEVRVEEQRDLKAGSILGRMRTEPPNEEKVEQALRQEIMKLSETPLNYREYRGAINTAVMSYWVQNQIRSVQIAGVTESILSGKGIAGYQQYPDLIQSVNQEDLQETAKRFFRLERVVRMRLHGSPKNSQ
jgi:zinc protease